MPKGKVPADVERYVQEHKDQGMDEGKAWAIAWSRYCVAEDTYVFTSSGVQTIGELAKRHNGPKVVHEDGSVASPLCVTVTTHKGHGVSDHIVYAGLKQVVKVITKHGYHLTCTPDHQLLVLNPDDYSVVWVNASDCMGKYLVLPSNGTWGSETILPKFAYKTNIHNNVIPPIQPYELSFPLARILGYLVSEGSITNEGVEFSNSDPAVVGDYVECMIGLFGESPRVDWEDPNLSNKCTKPRAKVRSRTRWYKEFFQSVGLCSGVAQDKRVPEIILGAPKEFVSEFIRGFIEGDGYVGDIKHLNRVDLSTSSQSLAHQLQVLLANFGVFCTLEKNLLGYFNVRVHGDVMVQRFVSAVGGGVFKKPAQTNTRLKQRGSVFECIPASGILRLHKRIANKFPGTNRISMSRVQSNWKLMESFAGGTSEVQNLRVLLDREYSFDVVQTIAHNGEENVYDLSVPGDNSFVANGLVAHNCEYKNPGSDHCRKDSYFEGRKAGSDPLRILNTTLHAKSGGDVGLSVTGYDPTTSTYLGSLVRWTSGQPLGVSERSYPIQDIKRVFDVRSGRYGSDKVLFKELVRVAKQQKGVRSHLLPLLHRYIKNP